MPSWKKIIVSGSNAELNQITSSAGINIKTVGSLSNGISFGDGNTGFYETADNDLKFDRAGINVFQANTSSQLAFGVSSLFYNQTGGFWIKTTPGSAGLPNYVFRGDENTGMFRIGADRLGFSAGGTLQLEISSNKISGSAQSTGSFGKLLGDGSSLTGVSSDLVNDTSPQLGGNLDLNSNNITGTGNIDILGTITAQNFIVSSSVTSIEYQSISGSTIFGDTADDIHTFLGDTISGSSTSTGSFGTLRIDGGVVDFDNVNNTFIGKNSKSSAITTADSNTVVGTNAGSALTSGDDNTLIGYNAGNDLTSGIQNTLIGYTAGDNITTQSGNVLIGKNTGGAGQQLSILIGNDTGRSITSGNGTVGIGHNTLYSLSTGELNTVVGYESMRAEVDGDRSTAFGYQTLRSQTGTDGTVGSTAIGYKAGYNATSGIHNIFVGADTNPSSGSSNNEIVIGYGVTGLGDNQTVIGNSSQTHVVFGGDALISGSAQSTGSFGRTEGTSFSYVFDANGSLVYDNDQLVYRNSGNDKFKVDNSQMTTEVVNTSQIKLGGENKVRFDETSVSFVISQNDGGMQDNLTLTKEGNLTLHRGGLTLAGDLTVNGDTTTISTSNILVQDAFGFFATGSAGTNVDAGIIVQSGSFIDSGSALYHDISKERWSVGKGVASTATSVPDSKWGGFVATVYTASASPVGSSPKYGVGEIHVDDDGEIYIYS